MNIDESLELHSIDQDFIDGFEMEEENKTDTACVPKDAQPITDEAMLEIMIQTLPIHLHDVKDMRKLINRL